MSTNNAMAPRVLVWVSAGAARERDEAEKRADEPDDASYQEGVENGKMEARGAHAELWQMVQDWLTKERLIPSPESDGHTAQDLMDAILVAFEQRKPPRDPFVNWKARAEALQAEIDKYAEAQAAERGRIADALEDEADVTPCAEDAVVVRDCADLVRADFSYDEAERIKEGRALSNAEGAGDGNE